MNVFSRDEIHREANTYPSLVDGGVPGNPEGEPGEMPDEAPVAAVFRY